MNNYLRRTIVLVTFGIVTFFIGLEFVREPNRLWDNHPPLSFFICLQAFFFMFGGVVIVKWLSLRKKMKETLTKRRNCCEKTGWHALMNDLKKDKIQNVIKRIKKYLFLIAGIIMIGYLIGTFFGNQSPVYKFGFEINIWIQRLFLTVIATGFMSQYLTKRKAE